MAYCSSEPLTGFPVLSIKTPAAALHVRRWYNGFRLYQLESITGIGKVTLRPLDKSESRQTPVYVVTNALRKMGPVPLTPSDTCVSFCLNGQELNVAGPLNPPTHHSSCFRSPQKLFSRPTELLPLGTVTAPKFASFLNFSSLFLCVVCLNGQDVNVPGPLNPPTHYSSLFRQALSLTHPASTSMLDPCSRFHFHSSPLP